MMPISAIKTNQKDEESIFGGNHLNQSFLNCAPKIHLGSSCQKKQLP
jgi:hypothetical protein